jgi:hypothetical protein
MVNGTGRLATVAPGVDIEIGRSAGVTIVPGTLPDAGPHDTAIPSAANAISRRTPLSTCSR